MSSVPLREGNLCLVQVDPAGNLRQAFGGRSLSARRFQKKASRSVDRGDRAGHGSEEEGSMKRSLMGVVGAKSRWGPHTGVYISGSGPPQEGGRGGVFPPSPSNGWLKLLPEYKLPSASSLPQSKGQLEYGEWAGHGQPLNTSGKRDVTCVYFPRLSQNSAHRPNEQNTSF